MIYNAGKEVRNLEQVVRKLESVAAALTLLGERRDENIRGESYMYGELADRLYECSDRLNEIMDKNKKG